MAKRLITKLAKGAFKNKRIRGGAQAFAAALVGDTGYELLKRTKQHKKPKRRR